MTAVSQPDRKMASKLMAELQAKGVQLWESAGELRYRAPSGVMSDDIKNRIRLVKPVLIDLLQEVSTPGLLADPVSALAPFPLTDIQVAYLLGRSRAIPYGGLPAIAYIELTLPVGSVDVNPLQAALQETIRRHGALRTIFVQEGFQRVMAEAPFVQIAHQTLEAASHWLAEVRQHMLSRRLAHTVDQWPGFELRLTDLPQEQILHLTIDLLVMDFVSVELWLRELLSLAHGHTLAPSPTISFRDAVVHRQVQRDSMAYQNDREYWRARLNYLPPAPDLPLRAGSDQSHNSPDIGSFRRQSGMLPMAVIERLQAQARHYGLTPSLVFLGAFAEVLACWSRRSAFTLVVTLMQRPDLSPELAQVLGDFTSTVPLAADMACGPNFTVRLQELQRRLWQDLGHSAVSGVEVQRELARAKGPEAAWFPIVFTSTMGALESAKREPGGHSSNWQLRDGITWTPQVWLDCQILVSAGVAHLNWDFRHDILDPSMVQAMHHAYLALLQRLSEDEHAWTAAYPVVLPAARIRTPLSTPFGKRLLHAGFLKAAQRWPNRIALSDSSISLCYGELLSKASSLAATLLNETTNTLVAIAMDKGAEQVIAALAVLMSGNAYVPIDVHQPPLRKASILSDAGVHCLLTQPHLAAQESYQGVQTRVVDLHDHRPGTVAGLPAVDPAARAYLIYTSGTTGRPKGVVMTHEAAANTVLDINARIDLGLRDAVLGLSGLGFDLSVYDIFGTLAAGAHLVLPNATRRSSPTHWAELMQAHAITVWNSVPAQADMLLQQLRAEGPAAVQSLRMAMLSGDWIPVDLASALQAFNSTLQVVSLGGATEAAIWSIWHTIDDTDSKRVSIPYGLPLTGQDVHVLNDRFQECPIGTVGQIHISGCGLAEGYHGDAEKTAQRFFVDPRHDRRYYCTGDLGRYMANGEIEFLGREDQQVKIRGHRIELGEIAAALELHPGVSSAVAVASKSKASVVPTLFAFVTPAAASAQDLAGRAQERLALKVALQGKSAGLEQKIPSLPLVRLSDALNDTVLMQLSAQLTAEFTQNQHHGLETGFASAWDAASLVRALGAKTEYTRLVYRCLIALHRQGLVVDRGDARFQFKGAPPVEAELSRRWHQLRDMAAEAEYPLVLLDYFCDSARQFIPQLRGQIDPLGLFFPQGRADVAMATFGGNASACLCNEIAAEAVSHVLGLFHANGRPLRVIEVGGGVGAVTAAILNATSGQRLEYVFTDVSAYFTQAAAQRFAADGRVRVATLDVTRTMDWHEPQCDVLVCGDLLHALSNVPAVLKDLSGLVRPGGWIVLLEATSEHSAALVSLELMLRNELPSGAFGDVRGTWGSTFADAPQWDQWLAESGWHSVGHWPHGALSNLGLQLIVAQNRPDLVAMDERTLQEHLQARLPAYMLPMRVRQLQSLPLSGNGKVDRSALLNLCETGEVSAADATDLCIDAGPLRDMLRLWQQSLGQHVQNVQSGFFDLGGDSLSAARLAGLVIESGLGGEGHHFDEVLRLLMEGCSIVILVRQLANGAVVLAPPLQTTSVMVASSENAEESVRVQFLEGPTRTDCLFVVIRAHRTAAAPLAASVVEALPGELAVLGAVAVVDPPGSAEQTGDWVAALLMRLQQVKAPRWCVFGLLAQDQDATWLLQERLRHDVVPAIEACCMLIASSAAKSAHPGRLQPLSPFVFDLGILRVGQVTNHIDEHIQALGQACLGQFDLLDVMSSSEAIDAALEWVLSNPSTGVVT